MKIKKIINKIILITLKFFNIVFQTLSKNTKFLVKPLSIYNQLSTSEITKLVAQINVLISLIVVTFKPVLSLLSNSKLFFKYRVKAIFLYCSSIFENRKPSIKNLKFGIFLIKFIIKLLFFCFSPVGSSFLLWDILDFSCSPTLPDNYNSFLKPKFMSSLKIIFNYLKKKRKNNTQTNENPQNSSEMENNNLSSNSSNAGNVEEPTNSIKSSNLEHPFSSQGLPRSEEDLNELNSKTLATFLKDGKEEEFGEDSLSCRTLSSTSSEAREAIKRIQEENLFEEDNSFFFVPEVKDPFANFDYSASSSKAGPSSLGKGSLGFEGYNRKNVFDDLKKLPTILEESDTELNSETLNESDTELNNKNLKDKGKGKAN
uniref:Uncharacterized protein n=1 Tax=Pleurotus eryngii TaxID=5323 RepID=A0A343AWQ1_PLEER|nr:hypothetical protein [Pleurotus eryngii]APT42213.1 hypothetical protein [Pleurotus eryngii]